MKYRVILLEQAQFELEELKSRLSIEAPQSAKYLIVECQLLFIQLQSFPYSYQPTADNRIRRAVLHSCRTSAYFTVTGDFVKVIALQPQILASDTLRRGNLAD